MRTSRGASSRALAGTLGLVLAGCGGAGAVASQTRHGQRTDPRCLPAWPVASRNNVAAGDSVVLRDRGLACDLFPRPQTYTVVLVAPAGQAACRTMAVRGD